MKRRIVMAIMVLIAAALIAAPEVGMQAPDFEAVDTYGNPVTLSDLRGQVVILEWTNHDCPYVRKHYGTGNMQALQKSTTEQGVVWISIISSAPGKQGHVSAARANELTAERDAAPSLIVLDPEGSIGRLYEARTTPHMFVIDPTGTLVYAGGIDDKPSSRWSTVEGARNYVAEAVNAVFAGNAVPVATTRAYGCTVKY